MIRSTDGGAGMWLRRRGGRRAAFAFGGALLVLASCVTTQDSPDPPKRWSVDVALGGRHIGTKTLAGWPPPLGACVDVDFVVNDFPVDTATKRPAAQVVFGFRHAGEPKGTIAINGKE